MNKYERQLDAACQSVAEEMGVVGAFEKNNPHNAFRVVLPDGSVVKISLSSTPRCAEHAIRKVRQVVRRAIARNLSERGLM